MFFKKFGINKKSKQEHNNQFEESPSVQYSSSKYPQSQSNNLYNDDDKELDAKCNCNSQCDTAQCDNEKCDTVQCDTSQQCNNEQCDNSPSLIHSQTQIITNTIPSITPVKLNLSAPNVTTEFKPKVDNSLWIQDLISKIETSRRDIEVYSKSKQDLISKEAQDKVADVIAENRKLEESFIEEIQSDEEALNLKYNKHRQEVLKQLDIEHENEIKKLQTQLKARQYELAQAVEAKLKAIEEEAITRKLEVVHDAELKAEKVARVDTAHIVP